MHVQKTVSIQEVWETGFNRQNESTTLCLFFLSFFTKHQHFSQWKDILIILSPWDKKCLIFYFNQALLPQLPLFFLILKLLSLCARKRILAISGNRLYHRENIKQNATLSRNQLIFIAKGLHHACSFSVSPTNLSLLRSPQHLPPEKLC